MAQLRNDPKKISVLIADKSIDPYCDSDVENSIYTVAFDLFSSGCNVDVVWSICGWKFGNFNRFYSKIKSRLEKDAKIQLEKRLKMWEGNTFMQKHAKENQNDEIKKLDEIKYYLRKNPIISLRDILQYDAIVLHLTMDDASKVYRFLKDKYRGPVLSSASGSTGPNFLSTSSVNVFERVEKDPASSAYVVYSTDPYGQSGAFSYDCRRFLFYYFPGFQKPRNNQK